MVFTPTGGREAAYGKLHNAGKEAAELSETVVTKPRCFLRSGWQESIWNLQAACILAIRRKGLYKPIAADDTQRECLYLSQGWQQPGRICGTDFQDDRLTDYHMHNEQN